MPHADGNEGSRRAGDDLALRAQRDPRVREELVLRHEGPVLGTLINIIKRRYPLCAAIWQERRGSTEELSPLHALARELIYERFMPALQSYDPERGASFQSWWITKARWELAQWMRDFAREAALLADRPDMEPRPEPAVDEECLNRAELEGQVAHILGLLADDEQEVLFLVHFAYPDARDPLARTAQRRGHTWQATRTTLRRARRHFRDAWIREYGPSW